MCVSFVRQPCENPSCSGAPKIHHTFHTSRRRRVPSDCFPGVCSFSLWQGSATKATKHSSKKQSNSHPGPPQPLPRVPAAPYEFCFSLAHLFLHPRQQKSARFNPTPRQHLADGKRLEGGGPSNAFRNIVTSIYRPDTPALWSNGFASVVHCSGCKLVKEGTKGGAGTGCVGTGSKEGRREKRFFLLLSTQYAVLVHGQT